ncbi:MAG TPA: dethiobiotin synthase [Verrucomicrobiota bacterium]|nr:dethiobiotin synthase [Verrucomicrobiota bacterium]HNT16192.1 dethiobiotin synthase [Verrucomicrobiota bacterium]
MKPPQILFVTGTDTGVGKTVFAALATLQLRRRGFCVAALKPVASGGRGDARILHAAAGKVLSLDEVNPWHFRAPIAPVLAAARERRRVRLREVVTQIRRVGRAFEVVVVEGAGGLLSPLGVDFDSRDLLLALAARPVVVCPNKLGAINQVRLALEALPVRLRPAARVVLVQPPRADTASRTNWELLQNFVRPSQLGLMPWIRD